jgi:hypothetical protein
VHVCSICKNVNLNGFETRVVNQVKNHPIGGAQASLIAREIGGNVCSVARALSAANRCKLVRRTHDYHGYRYFPIPPKATS